MPFDLRWIHFKHVWILGVLALISTVRSDQGVIQLEGQVQLASSAGVGSERSIPGNVLKIGRVITDSGQLAAKGKVTEVLDPKYQHLVGEFAVFHPTQATQQNGNPLLKEDQEVLALHQPGGDCIPAAPETVVTLPGKIPPLPQAATAASPKPVSSSASAPSPIEVIAGKSPTRTPSHLIPEEPVTSVSKISHPSHSPSIHKEDNPPLVNTHLVSLKKAVRTSHQARSVEIFKNARDRMKTNEKNARRDQKLLEEIFKNTSVDELDQTLTRSQKALERSISAFESATGGSLTQGQRAMIHRDFLNARDKASGMINLLDSERTKAQLARATHPFAQLLTPESLLDEKRISRKIAQKMKDQPILASATSKEALANRMILFHSLKEDGPDSKANVAQKLRLLEPVHLTGANGKQTEVLVPHNGYIIGAGKSGIDCSSLASAALPPEVRKGVLTTLDMKQIWVYLEKGRFPVPPLYKKKREKWVKKYASSFYSVNPYKKNMRLYPGDLLGYRVSWSLDGHVFIVKDYNPRTKVARVIEASQSAGTIRERDFPLSLDSPHAEKRFVRPGLFALRLKPKNNSGCQYKKQNLFAGNRKSPIRGAF